jgi:uncharacterized phiE125 gp8 family phage protein
MTVPLSTIKDALKIDYSDDDAQLTRLRDAAWAHIERRTQLVLTRSDQTMYIGDFKSDVLPPRHPFASVTSITYTALDGSSVSLSAYWVDRTEPMPMIRFLDRPQVKEGTAVAIVYIAGYTEMPGEIVHAVIALVGAWYSNPEALQPTAMSSVPLSLDYILESISVRSLIR